jgi:hypothetical protein
MMFVFLFKEGRGTGQMGTKTLSTMKFQSLPYGVVAERIRIRLEHNIALL